MAVILVAIILVVLTVWVVFCLVFCLVFWVVLWVVLWVATLTHLKQTVLVAIQTFPPRQNPVEGEGGRGREEYRYI